MPPRIGEIDKRPWGSWETIDCGKGFQIKKITVLPGKRLSLQSHLHRKEHWVIIAGEAEVELDGKIFHLNQSDYIDIPLRSKHRLCNKGEFNLVVCEVQFGQLLEEDDIIRYEDDFGRE